jgi:hypothetical protein
LKIGITIRSEVHCPGIADLNCGKLLRSSFWSATDRWAYSTRYRRMRVTKSVIEAAMFALASNSATSVTTNIHHAARPFRSRRLRKCRSGLMLLKKEKIEYVRTGIGWPRWRKLGRAFLMQHRFVKTFQIKIGWKPHHRGKS